MTTERIDFDKKTGLPGSITVTLTLAEAVFIAKFCGNMSALTANKLESDGDEAIQEIWTGLSSDLFCRYWDGGVSDLYTIPGFNLNQACVDYLKKQDGEAKDSPPT